MELAVGVVSLMLGAVIGAVVTAHLQRPLLRVVSSSWSGATGLSIEIANRPAVIGIDAPVSGKSCGLTVPRWPAQDCAAWLLDDSGTTIDGLIWAGPEWQAASAAPVTIESGRSDRLWLLARHPVDGAFYVYHPGSDLSRRVDLPATLQVRIQYAFGVRTQTFRLDLMVNEEGNPEVKVKRWLSRR